MRIGILTYWTSLENYGQILQLYALYTYLKTQGHDVFVIKYDGYGDNSLDRSFRERLKNLLVNPLKLLTYLRQLYRERIIQADLSAHDCEFSRFKERHFQWSRLYHSYADLRDDPPKADIYICGSDMIWGANANRYKAFFLGFGGDQIKRIAYAPSFGSGKVSDTYLRKIKPYLDKFDLISTREESGRDICRNLGFRDAQWFPDPTSLLSAKDYMDLSSCSSRKNPYVFMYLMGHPTSVPFRAIEEFAKTRNLKIIYRASQGRRDKWPKLYPTIEEWIGCVSQADYIITNSFHGCMFALIFKKKFLFIPLIRGAKHGNDRICSLLKKLHLTDRIWKGNIGVLENDINYISVDKEMNAWIMNAKDTLNKHLQENI